MTSEFIESISGLVKNPKVILEIGSRDCLQAIEFSEAFPTAKIYAFECNPEAIEICKKNIKDYDNIKLVEKAAYNRNDVIKFYQMVYNNIGASSTHKPLSKMIERDGLMLGSIIDVKAIRIDTWCLQNDIEKIDLAWLDVQGAEMEVLLGFGGFLYNVNALHTEVTYKPMFEEQKFFPELNDFFYNNGFILLYNIPNNPFWGDAAYLNMNIIKEMLKNG